MRRFTPGAFSEIEPHTPRVCGPKSSVPFNITPASLRFRNDSDTEECEPPPIPSRLQPPPLPPKHHLRGLMEAKVGKYKETVESSDTYGRDVYESINEAAISPNSKINSGRSRRYATRDLGVSMIDRNSMRRGCINRKPSGPSPCGGTAGFEVSYSPTFAMDPNTGISRGPCTCNLGGGINQSSPVWSKMNPDESLAFLRNQSSTPEQIPLHARTSKATSGSVPNILDKKSRDSSGRSSTVARLSRTVSRFFRRKSSSRKNVSGRSSSVFFNECPEKPCENSSVPPQFNICPPCLPTKQSPSTYRICSPTPLRPPSIRVPIAINSPPLPPAYSRSSPLTDENILCCSDHPKPVSSRLQQESTEIPCGSNCQAVSCVHHVHHIHHVHHVHHHLHHAASTSANPTPPPPPPRPPLAPTTSSSAVPVLPSEDAAAFVRMLEATSNTLVDTPPPILPQLKDFKSRETPQTTGAPHTYSAYGVHGASTAVDANSPATGCSLSPTPPVNTASTNSSSSLSTSNSLHRHSTTVCSTSRCLAPTHFRHTRGSPGSALRTPCSAELAEIVEVGASPPAADLLFATRSTRSREGGTSRTSSSSGNSPAVLHHSLLPPESSSSDFASAYPPSPPPHHQVHHLHHHEFLLHPTQAPTPVAVAIAAPAPSTLPSTLDHRSSFQESMKALRKMGWYWGPLSFTEADKLLVNRPDGTFLVRDSAHDTFFLSLSFRVGGNTYHTRIEHNQGRFSFWFEPESHSASTVVEFIKKAVAHSIGGKYHYFLQTSTPGQQPVEVSLLYPLSRFQVVQSLKHLARFTVLSNVRRDHISQLPLPPMQRTYLLEKQVYCESLEDFEEAIRDRPALQFTSQPPL